MGPTSENGNLIWLYNVELHPIYFGWLNLEEYDGDGMLVRIQDRSDLKNLTYIVLYWRGGLYCPRHCDLFAIYCASPNLGTRTWIYRLKFAQRSIFLRLMSFNEPEISHSGPPSLNSLPEEAQNFYVLKKSIDLSRVWTRQPWISSRARYPETTKADI